MSTKKENEKKENTMVGDFEDAKNLGKEMEQQKTSTEVEKEGKIPSPQEKTKESDA